jgi:hypothetical protein
MMVRTDHNGQEPAGPMAASSQERKCAAVIPTPVAIRPISNTSTCATGPTGPALDSKKTASVPFSNSLSNSSYGCLRDSRSPRDDVRGQCPEGPPTERRGMVTRHKLFQLRPSLHQWLVAKILPFRCRRSKPQKIRVCGRHRIADFSASKSEAPCPF